MAFRKTIVSLWIVIFSHCVQACRDAGEEIGVEAISSLTATLIRNQIIAGSFEQQRNMQMLKKPLHSSGQILYSTEHGLYWKVVTPFAFELVMTPDYLLQVNGSNRHLLRAEDHPAVFSMSRIFSAILAGDFSRAGDYFKIKQGRIAEKTVLADGLPDGLSVGEWSFCLQPLSAPMNQWLDHVEISGNAFVREVRLVDLNQDNTHIRFRDMHTQPQLDEQGHAVFRAP